MTEMQEPREPGQILTRLWVPGRPRTKGSMNAYCSKGPQHKLIWKEQVKEGPAWRKKVAAAVQADMILQYGRVLKLEVPVEVRAVYFFRRDLEDMSSEPYPTAITVGDRDKLDRNVGDALESSGLIANDKLIVYGPSGKFWGTEQGLQLMVVRAPVDPVAVQAYAERMRSLAGGEL